jgi:RimJ/RimL family protein N-acetyltransferase
MTILPLMYGTEWQWLKDQAGTRRCEDTQGIVAYKNDQIAAVAVFDTFSNTGCNVHWAIEDPMVLRHGFLEEMFGHLFLTLKRTRIFGHVPSDNEKSLKLCRHLGMREVARIPHGAGEGVDYIIMEMTRDKCRWIPEELREAA